MPDPQVEPTLGIALTSPSPELAQICGNAGFGVVLIDMEHGPISIESAYRMVTALRHTPAEAWIRVTGNDPNLIKLALDAGAVNIMVPMVTTKTEAQAAVSAAKYPPLGTRGFGPFLEALEKFTGQSSGGFLLVAPILDPDRDQVLAGKIFVGGLGDGSRWL